MKRVILILTLILSNSYLFAQKSNKHLLFVGSNISSISIDYKNIGVNYSAKNNGFNNSKIGFIIGYSYRKEIANNKLVLAGGLKLYNFKVAEFDRPENNNSPSGTPKAIYERLSNFRISLPLEVSYNFIKKEDVSFFVTTAIEPILLNQCKREADYFILSPPNGFTLNTFEATQKIKFGTDNSTPLGISAAFGIGSNFAINKKNRYSVMLNYLKDLSKSKILTLKNIENDGYYNIKYSFIELKIGYVL